MRYFYIGHIKFLCFLLLSINLFGQEKDTLLFPSRDIVGDLNKEFIKAGEIPGAILLPGTNISLAIGGFIKATAFYDTRYTEKNEIIMPGTFSTNSFPDGQTYIGARSSRLFFDGRSNIDYIGMRGYIEMDFRGSYGITLRHIYLKISNQTGQSLLMGQYWSYVMDLQSIPEGLVEPTMSGALFARHGQIRFNSTIIKILNAGISIEEPNNSDIKGISIQTLNKYPDIAGNLSLDPSPAFHFSVMGMYRPITASTQSEQLNKAGYLTNAVLVIKPDQNQKIILSGLFGKGASNYIMGADGTAGYISNNSIELQNQYGGFFSYHYKWSELLRSNIALGRFAADELSANPNSYIKSSTYCFINTFFHLNKYINIGIEWIYTEKNNYNGGSFYNNRFEFGIQVF